jgi:hypothetical protein
MLFRLLAVLAEFERDLVAERTRAALAYKRANGERIGAIPFGFDLADDGTSLIHNPVEQRALRKIRDMRQRGATLQRIADVLTRAGVSYEDGKITGLATYGGSGDPRPGRRLGSVTRELGFLPYMRPIALAASPARGRIARVGRLGRSRSNGPTRALLSPAAAPGRIGPQKAGDTCRRTTFSFELG